MLHTWYIVYLLLVLLWLVLTCLCIAAMHIIGIYINLLSFLWTLPASIHEIKNVHFLSRYRDGQYFLLRGTTKCMLRPSNDQHPTLWKMHSNAICGRNWILGQVSLHVWHLMYSCGRKFMEKLRSCTSPLFSFNYCNLIFISILSRSYNDIVGKWGVRIHNVTYLYALLKSNMAIP